MPVAHVLLVDDDPALLQALPETLRLRLPNVIVETCETSRSALARLNEVDYDVIISDVKMPFLDGFALLHEAKKVRRWTPFLLLTGHGEPSLIGKGLAMGAYDVLQKPIDRDDFILSAKRALEARSLRRQVEAQEEIMGRLTLHLAQLDQRWRRTLESQKPISALFSQSQITKVWRRRERVFHLLMESHRGLLQCYQELSRWSTTTPKSLQQRTWLRRQELVLKRYQQRMAG